MAVSSRRARHKAARRRTRHPAGHSTPPPVRVRLRKPKDRRLVKVLRTIRQHPRASLKELARPIELSVSRLKHLFKSQTGLSIGSYLMARRLAQAADLLRQTELRVKEIARRAGYAHTPSFSRAFARAFGVPPWLYRNTTSSANE